jgi:hypothetical protein
MEIDKPHRGGSPVSLSALLDEAAQRLPPRQAGPTASDGFLFSGNRHESVPRALFFDHRLTPLERNAWQVFRLLLDDEYGFPPYRWRPSHADHLSSEARQRALGPARQIHRTRHTRRRGHADKVRELTILPIRTQAMFLFWSRQRPVRYCPTHQASAQRVNALVSANRYLATSFCTIT